VTQSNVSDATADAESQIQEIVPGLYRLRTPMTSNALPWIMPYAFRGATGVTLFDSGYGTPEAQEALTAQLAVLGYRPSDVQRLIVSHAHPDHLGLATWLREQAPDHELILLGAEADWFDETHRHDSDWFERNNGWLIRHGIDPDEIDDEHSGPPWKDSADAKHPGDEKPDAATETNRRSWQMEHVTPDRRMNDGDILEFDGWRLQCVWTPGHTPGHLCAYETNHRLTFTGDHVLSRITPHVGYSGDDEARHRNPLRDFRASLEKVAALDTALALPAHEELIEDLPARCRAIIEHHDHRLDEVRDGIGTGRASGIEIASVVTWNKPWSTFSLHKKRMAMGETVSHLELLRHEGRVRRIEDDNRILWERA
jgi:glyoxylase-like metal-dependent hydrolase (beta-lactamase superfamily II)